MRVPKKARTNRVKMSTVPFIGWTEESIKLIKQMMQMPERANRVRLLFLLDLSNFLREKLLEKAPNMEIGDKEINYVEKMQIGILEEKSGFDSVAMWLEDVYTKITTKNIGSSVLYFRMRGGSPDWIRVLVDYNPWPAELVPVPVSKTDAKTISRIAREDEISILKSHILSRKKEIETNLSKSGLHVVIGEGDSRGTDMLNDIGYNILRRELGMDGYRQQAHWRPAMREMKKYLPNLMGRVNKYMMTGNESIFNIPSDVGNVDKSVFNKGDGFMKEIKAISPIK